MVDMEKIRRQMAKVKLPVNNERLEHINKVTFETTDGRTFTFFEARVWKMDFAGNLAYQIRGEYPDLEQVLPKLETDGVEKKNDMV